MILNDGIPTVELYGSNFTSSGYQQIFNFKEPVAGYSNIELPLKIKANDEGEFFIDVNGHLHSIERGLRPSFRIDWKAIGESSYNAVAIMTSWQKAGGLFKFYPVGIPADSSEPNIWFYCYLTDYDIFKKLDDIKDIGYGPGFLEFQFMFLILSVPVTDSEYQFVAVGEAGYDADEIIHFTDVETSYNLTDAIAMFKSSNDIYATVGGVEIQVASLA